MWKFNDSYLPPSNPLRELSAKDLQLYAEDATSAN
jgi:hypothetical protein